jgi:hypothetical protein
MCACRNRRLLAGVSQVAVFEAAHQQRPEADSAAAGVREPTYHKLLTVDALELQPICGSALDVQTVSPLGNDAFPPPAFASW